MRPLNRRTVPRQVRDNRGGVKSEKRKPNVPGRWIYVGDFVGPDDPANDPEDATYNSPPWLNDFYYVDGAPVGFRHGLDGQTDMTGVYDLTLGAVSGTVAFVMPLQWAMNLPLAAMMPIELQDDVWSIAIQTVDFTTGNIRIFWPIVADPI